MNRWFARLVALAIAAAAVYLVYANVHSGSILLECTLGAAILAIATTFLLWRRPAAASILNAVWIAGAFVASASLTPNRQLPNIVAQPGQAPATVAATNQQPAANGNPSETLTAPATTLPSMNPASGALSAPWPGIDFSEFIGKGSIDDGTGGGPDVGKPTVAALNRVTAAFGGQPNATPAPPAFVEKLRETDARIPESEYSLAALSQTLPKDPVAIYRFVRDNVTIDPYDGIMRGPLGTWLSRAGSPSDKLTLLAWIFANKSIPFQFVRGNLSDDERERIVASAAVGHAGAAAPAHNEDPSIQAKLQGYVRDGNTFSQWATQQLAKSNVRLGGNGPAHISSRHYWLQVDNAGKVLDLDPTLPNTIEGQHLGTVDASFKPWAMLPADEWHYVQIRILAAFRDGSSNPIIQYVAKTSDLSYGPVRFGAFPKGEKDLAKLLTTRAFDLTLLNGGAVVGTGSLDLDAHGGVSRVWMEIRRKDVAGNIVTSTRDFVPANTPGSAQGPALAGLTTIVIVPGSGFNLFELHEYVKTVARLANAAASATGGRMKPIPVYPLAIADFFFRDDAVAASLASGAQGRFYRNRPAIVLERTWYQTKSGAASSVLGFDIVDDGMSSVSGDTPKTAAANLTRGYADVQIEHDVIGSNNAYNTIGLFDIAQKSGTSPVVITRQQDAPQIDATLARGLDGTLQRGSVAIAPSRSVALNGAQSFGWWEIDPSTGSAVGRMSGGAGEAAVSYSVILQYISIQLFYAEMAHAVYECTEDAHACVRGLCGAAIGAGFALTAVIAGPVVISMGPMLAALAVAVAAEAFAQLVACNMSDPGSGGGGEGGGAPPDPGPPTAPGPPYCIESLQCQ